MTSYVLANANNFDFNFSSASAVGKTISVASPLGGYNFYLGGNFVPMLFNSVDDAHNFIMASLWGEWLICAVEELDGKIASSEAIIVSGADGGDCEPLSSDDYPDEEDEHPHLSCEEQDDGYDYDRYY